ncbi:Crp/Fnr family transcriptional regulator [Pleurocapsales cyanobacterium LEGE 10410]|nr:Crp/Fnr family transcriptional regulator [Pleurocapsales cyanobacterium LEGE 10410]
MRLVNKKDNVNHIKNVVRKSFNRASNRLLQILPSSIYQKLEPHFRLVDLTQGEILHLPGETIQEVYFPIDCMLSITLTMYDGSTIETGLVGNRDVLGINALMGRAETTHTEYIVQVSGRAIKINAWTMRSLFLQHTELQDIMLRHTQALIAQISQTAACNRFHSIEQRLARWLLEACDRSETQTIYLTHEFMSNMLGVRRTGVTLAASKLQNENIIRYNRGHIEIIDRQKLEEISCECFCTVKAEYDRLLGTLNNVKC